MSKRLQLRTLWEPDRVTAGLLESSYGVGDLLTWTWWTDHSTYLAGVQRGKLSKAESL